VRLEQSGSAVDWSLSYFDGLDTIPDLALSATGLRGPELVLQSHRVRVVGIDAATAVGPYSLRGEAAYTFTEDENGADPAIKNPFLFVVVGGDRTFVERLNVNLQYILRVVMHYQSPFDIANPLTRDVAVQAALLDNQLDHVHYSFSAVQRGEARCCRTRSRPSSPRSSRSTGSGWSFDSRDVRPHRSMAAAP
jgi:hypothetical protein